MSWPAIIAIWLCATLPLGMFVGRILGGYRHADETPTSEWEG